jgi:hypothetical protein
MIGRTTEPASAPNSTAAMGMPLTRLFFDPAKTRVIRSAGSKTFRRPNAEVAHRTTASRPTSTATKMSKRAGVRAVHNPSAVPWLNAV